MEFRLTYQGELFSSQPTDTQSKVDRRAGHKHSIRRVFHKQLKRLWEITPFLKNGGGGGPVALVTGKGHSPVYALLHWPNDMLFTAEFCSISHTRFRFALRIGNTFFAS